MLSDETSLEVTVFSVDLGLEPFSDDSALPTHGPPRFHNAITAGRVGGARSGEGHRSDSEHR